MKSYKMDSENDKCIICQGELSTLRRSRRIQHVNNPGCNYQAHQNCLDRFMNSNVQYENQELDCPGCRQPIIGYLPPMHIRRSLQREYVNDTARREEDARQAAVDYIADVAAYQAPQAPQPSLEERVHSLQTEVLALDPSAEWFVEITAIDSEFTLAEQGEIYATIKSKRVDYAGAGDYHSYMMDSANAIKAAIRAARAAAVAGLLA